MTAIKYPLGSALGGNGTVKNFPKKQYEKIVEIIDAVNNITDGSTTTDSITPASGTLTITGNEILTGTLVQSNTTDATTKDTGAIITEGGIGVEKAIVAGTSITATTRLFTGAGTVSAPGLVIGANDNGIYEVSSSQEGFSIGNTLVGGFNSTGLFANVISEQTAASGVTIDGVLLKDGQVYTGSVPAYSLGLAVNDVVLSGTTLTLTAPQFFTSGNTMETTLTGTATYGTGSNLGTTGLTAAKADVLSLYNTLKALSGTAIITPSALEGDNYGYGAGVFVPGVYTTASAIGVTAAGTITLSGDGDYVFVSTGGAITFGATVNLVLTNGAKASRIFWVANNAITTGASDTIKGNFMSGAAGAITIGASNIIEGRLLSPVAVTIDGTTSNFFLPLA